MKTRVIILLASFLLSVSVSIFSNAYVTGSMLELQEMRNIAQRHAEGKRYAEAAQITSGMLALLREKTPVLEMLTPHEDLHALMIELCSASVSLSVNDTEEYRKSVDLLKETIDHLISHESLSFSNIF